VSAAAPEATLQRFCAGCAGDLRALARLHDRELDRETVHALWRDCYEEFLALRLQGQRAGMALGLLREGLTELPTELCQSSLDRLAADYADIYLTYGLRASPCESVWLDEDNLAMQEPMFRVRGWYRRHGLAVEDWRKRSDDHLVNELLFVAHLLESDPHGTGLAEAARFMDEHPLRWVQGFAERVAGRCESRLYAGLALLTAAYLDELRDLLAEVLGTARPSAEELALGPAQAAPPPEPAEGPFLPGAAPSW
jgi:TorA maturation chaperone TorD